MSTKLNDTQFVLLSAASQRDDHCLAPPTGPKQSLVQKAAAKLLEAGLVKEMRAKAGAPIWRRDEETGRTYSLKLTAAGVKAIRIGETPPSQEEAEPRADHPVDVADPQPECGSNRTAAVNGPDSGATRIPVSPRSGTKIAEVIALLKRSDGASLAELVAATGWLAHTTRAALTGLRKRGYAIAIGRTDKRGGSVYRIEPTEMSSDSVDRSEERAPTDDVHPDRPARAARQRSPQAA